MDKVFLFRPRVRDYRLQRFRRSCVGDSKLLVCAEMDLDVRWAGVPDIVMKLTPSRKCKHLNDILMDLSCLCQLYKMTRSADTTRSC